MRYDPKTDRYYATPSDIVEAEKAIKKAKAFRRKEKREMIKRQLRLEALIKQELYGTSWGDQWQE
jgi:hypothetical protein